MNVKVTSASKKEQKLSRVAAAMFVITQEDILRSGATNIEDALRIVPGLDVAEINGSTWAIGARSFNEQLSNKLLVIVDGRIVYTEAFGGVYWDAVDVPLEDIDRIEVIRGPGGSIWGANAVNGVISIFTSAPSRREEGSLQRRAAILYRAWELSSMETRSEERRITGCSRNMTTKARWTASPGSTGTTADVPA